MSDVKPDELPPEPVDHEPAHVPVSASDLPEPFADPPELPASEDAIAAPSESGNKFKSYLQMAGIFSACVYVMATTSLLLNRPTQTATVAPKPAAPKSKVASKLEILAPRLEDVDARLRSGDYGEALRSYEMIAKTELGTESVKLRYRIGLCQEALGNHEEASDNYREITEHAPSEVIRWVSRVSQARSWLRHGQFSRARQLLGGLVLEGPKALERPHPVIAEAFYLFAMTSRHLETPKATHPGEPVLARPPMNWPVETIVGWIDGDVDVPAAPEKVVPRRKSNERENVVSDLPIARIIDIPSKNYSAVDLITEIAKVAKYELEMTDELKTSLAEREFKVQSTGLPLSVWLTAIADAINVRWLVAEDKLYIAKQQRATDDAEKVDKEKFADDTSVSAELALRFALDQSPSHRLAPSARLYVGNMYYLRKQFAHALLEFQDLVKTTVSPTGLAATYNVGLVFQKMQRFESSRAALFRVMDGNPEHPMASVSAYLIGRMYLDEGLHLDAVGPLEFAARSKMPDESRAPAAVYAAIAHLLSDNYHEAGAILFNCQRTFQKIESMRDAAAFLNSYARFQSLAGNSELQRRETVYLFRSLFALGSDATWLGPYGMLLVGRAYRDLGMKAQMIRVFERSLDEGATGITASEMRYLRLEARLEKEDTQATARDEMIRFSNAEFDNKWGQRARLRIARLDYDMKKFEDCIQGCRELVNASHIESFELLRLMGHAYESLDQHRNAAMCFAGQVPPQS